MDIALKEHIYNLETRLLQSEVRQSKKELDVLLADDFRNLRAQGGGSANRIVLMAWACRGWP
ncbi:hypothetical protein [Fictibacillus sp. FJAT-27399]|uniref:hypothetical protein n=1 Tax=Fictibacillus sp. FJAT-27399 TaxID=1729689 RepID=UPI000782F14D|nr:hypothetical protein [Fictibacillus sp. FJAT-27399]